MAKRKRGGEKAGESNAKEGDDTDSTQGSMKKKQGDYGGNEGLPTTKAPMLGTKKPSKGLEKSNEKKAIPKSWTVAEETAFLSEIEDIANNGDIDWVLVQKNVNQKLGLDLNRSQVYEKARRLKGRYLAIEAKKEAGEAPTFINSNEEKMYTLSQHIWGGSETQKRRKKEESERKPAKTAKAATRAAGLDAKGHEAKRRAGKSKGSRESMSANENHSLQAPVEFSTGSLDQEKNDPVRMAKRRSGKPKGSLGSTSTNEKRSLEEPDELSCGSLGQEKNHLVERLQEKTSVEHHDRTSKIQGTEVNSQMVQRVLEIFHSEREALLQGLQERCDALLEDFQSQLMVIVNDAAKGAGTHDFMAWMGGTPSLLSLKSWQCISSDGFSSNHEDQWQKHHLEELKLASEELQLLLEQCYLEQMHVKWKMGSR